MVFELSFFISNFLFFNMYITLNSKYMIKNEQFCSYIVIHSSLIDRRMQGIPSVMPIPPIYGYILSSFNGDRLKDTIQRICNEINISESKLEGIISKWIDNPDIHILNYKNERIYFPPYLLIKSHEKADVSFVKEFNAYNNFILDRPKTPFFLNIMITSKCQTDCIYCYADRSRKDDMETAIILKIIDEAHISNIPNVQISGGDILANKEWKKIISRLVLYNYRPFISTKIPLNEEDVIFLKKNNFSEIQFSLDSFDFSELKQIVKVGSEYINKVKDMFVIAQKYNFNINIKSVLTKLNSDIESLKLIFSSLSRYNCIKTWNIVPAFYSAHKDNYINYEASEEQLKAALKFIKSLKPSFVIFCDKLENISTKQIKYQSCSKFISENKLCAANSYSMSIMSNGMATICEMLYYNELFYIGDITKDSLINIWNSQKALELYRGKKEIQKKDEPSSPCLICVQFDKCKGRFLKKVCYVDIANTYNNNRWDLPDPRCPKSSIMKCNLDKMMKL